MRLSKVANMTACCVRATLCGANLCWRNPVFAKLRKRIGMQFVGQVELERRCSLANLCKGNDVFCGSSVCDNVSTSKVSVLH